MLIERVTDADLPELLALLRGYCDFYRVTPSDEALLSTSRSLLADPGREGIQLIARDGSGRGVGFATVFWSWQTSTASRIGVMNDLYVSPEARRGGYGRTLIRACLVQCGEHGASALTWQTAKDNLPAQRLYESVGARREEWLDYSLEV